MNVETCLPGVRDKVPRSSYKDMEMITMATDVEPKIGGGVKNPQNGWVKIMVPKPC